MDTDQLDAKEFMEEEPVTASEEMSLTQVKNRMEELDRRAMPVTRGEELVGVIGYRDLIRHLQLNPSTTGLEKVMHQPPQFKESDSMTDLAKLRIESGRKLMLTTSGDRLDGVVSDREFLSAFSSTEMFQNLDLDDLATAELKTVFEEDSIERARHMMLDSSISRLPVKDDSGRLTGILKSTDLLKAMVVMDSEASGYLDSSNEGSEKEPMNEIPVREIMDRTPAVIDPETDLDHCIQTMQDQDVTELVVTDGKSPEAMLTVKDLIQHVEDGAGSDTVLVNLVGVEVDEEKEAIHEKVSTQIRGSIGRKLRNPEELTVHLKKRNTDGKKHRYDLNLRLRSEFGTISVQHEDWDLLDAVDSALDKLNKRIGKEKGKKRDRRQ